jgi:hypothetical protein
MSTASAVLAGAGMVFMRAVTSLDGSRVDRIGALQGARGLLWGGVTQDR